MSLEELGIPWRSEVEREQLRRRIICPGEEEYSVYQGITRVCGAHSSRFLVMRVTAANAKYAWVGRRLKVKSGVVMKLETRVFELYSGKYATLPELAQAMGISRSQIYHRGNKSLPRI